jgi:hypothetical protein
VFNCSFSYLNADSAFDTKGTRKISFDNGAMPNMAENRRGRKKPKRGRKRLFCEKIYKNRDILKSIVNPSDH